MDINLSLLKTRLLDEMDINLCFPDKLVVDQTDVKL